MKRETGLAAVHYDEGLLADFISRLEKINNIQDIEIGVRWGDGDSASYSRPEEFVEDTNVPSRLLRFSIQISGEGGRLTIHGNGHAGREIHSLRLVGEMEWVYTNLSAVKEFVELHKDRFRDTFRNRRLLYFQALLIGMLAFLVGDYLILSIVPMIHPAPLPGDTKLIAIGIAVSIGLLQISKSAYPYVVISKRGEEPLFKKVIVGISVTVGIISGAITIAQYLPLF